MRSAAQPQLPACSTCPKSLRRDWRCAAALALLASPERAQHVLQKACPPQPRPSASLRPHGHYARSHWYGLNQAVCAALMSTKFGSASTAFNGCSTMSRACWLVAAAGGAANFAAQYCTIPSRLGLDQRQPPHDRAVQQLFLKVRVQTPHGPSLIGHECACTIEQFLPRLRAGFGRAARFQAMRLAAR